ncbi:3'-5' exoribonuclease [Caminicella sporogenes DSM 14501]|uniref:3'-5' exoribonuclease n=1 Tax=Caminicella sporogenes DSM 14501 TaxID=1121266 RepID=A0A1M6PC36_9FIRM|nr:HD domain-containing protein [Caminicella sporogenes]RKD21455.1 CMP-binding protein [Caminicella sporogenes]SHK05494.1 3'-5' exoribonuclease [Caminicella sporogenes DSM 14501]
MEIKKIIEFQNGDYIEGFFLIKSVEVKTSSNNKNYMDFTLIDNTGEINAKLWECTKEDEEKYLQYQLIKVRGNVIEWQGRLQLKIVKIRHATKEDNLNIEDYVLCAPQNPQYMFDEVVKYIEKIENQDIKKIVESIIYESKDKLLFYPAAKINHHAVRSGLLYHILTMLKSAERLSEVYTHLNTDLLFAGVILHDIAKVDEMEANKLGIVSDYSSEGQLLGHIIQGIKKIDRVATKIGADEEISMLLQHMVLSHHYEPEFGSPKRPMIPEAELLHYLDIIDARMFDMQKAIEGINSGDFSDKIWILHNRKVYNSNLKKG